MPKLITDKSKCVGCNSCEEILPTFRHKHNGELYISYARMRDSVLVQEAVKLVIAECQGNAIRLERA